jgi:hypothetical protein
MAVVNPPPQVKQVLEKDCYGCHSDERRLVWFDQIVPGYGLVRYDVQTARERLNFSTPGSKAAAVQESSISEDGLGQTPSGRPGVPFVSGCSARNHRAELHPVDRVVKRWWALAADLCRPFCGKMRWCLND